MNNGWIKMHRKAEQSPIWKDQNAWRVFQWILWNVDYETGIGTFGRNQIAKGTGLKNSTAYKVATRLHEKYQVLSLKSNNQFTEFRVLNWAKYQQGEIMVASTVNEKEHVTSTKSSTIKEYKEIKNKEIKKERENKSLTYLENLPEEDVMYFTATWDLTKSQLLKKAQQLMDYCLSHDKKYKDYKAFLRSAVRRDFKLRPFAEPTVEYEFDSEGLARIKKLKAEFTIKGMDTHRELTDFEVNDRRNLLDKQAEQLRRMN